MEIVWQTRKTPPIRKLVGLHAPNGSAGILVDLDWLERGKLNFFSLVGMDNPESSARMLALIAIGGDSPKFEDRITGDRHITACSRTVERLTI